MSVWGPLPEQRTAYCFPKSRGPVNDQLAQDKLHSQICIEKLSIWHTAVI